jgi:nicotinamidase-related amidase
VPGFSTHYYEEDLEFRTWSAHVKHETWGCQIVDEPKPQPGDSVIQKTKYDGFYSTLLEDLLRVYGDKHLVVTSTVVNICVLHTAGSAALRWFKIYITLDMASALSEFG